MTYNFDFARKFYYACEKLCKNRHYNLVLHKHLGDLVYQVSIQKELEAHFKAPFHFIVRPNHEFLLKMYGVTNYSILDIDSYSLKTADFYDVFKIPFPAMLDAFVHGALPGFPILGTPFHCDSQYDNFLHFSYYFGRRWGMCMELLDCLLYPLPPNIPHLSKKAQKQVLSIAGSFDKIIVVAPDATTAIEFPDEFWEILIKKFLEKNFTVFVNSTRHRFKNTHSLFDLGMTLEDVVALCYGSAYVFALRSGLCDVIAGIQERLFAFYPSMLRREVNGLNCLFAPPKPINEILVADFHVDDFFWEGENLGASLRQYAHKCQRRVLHYYAATPLSVCKKYQSKKAEVRCLRSTFGARKSIYRNNNKEHVACKDKVINYLSIPLYAKNYSRNNGYTGCAHSFLGFPVFERSLYKNRKGDVNRTFFNGLIAFKDNKVNRTYELTLSFLSIFKKKLKKGKHIYYLFGLPLFKRSLREKFFSQIYSVARQYKTDSVYICPHHLGESYIFIHHLSSLLKKNKPVPPPLLLCVSESQRSLFYMLPNNDNWVIDNNVLININVAQEFLDHQNIRYRGIEIRSLAFSFSDWLQHAVPDGTHVIDRIRDLLNLGTQPRFQALIPSKRGSTRVEDIMVNLNLYKNKFIILCPEASTAKTLEPNFWTKLEGKFHELGYDTIINKEQACIFAGSDGLKKQTITLSIEELFHLASQAKGVVGLASGLTFPFAELGIERHIIYTDTRNRVSSQRLKKLYSLQKLPMLKKPNKLYEYCLSEEENQEIVFDKIVGSFVPLY